LKRAECERFFPERGVHDHDLTEAGEFEDPFGLQLMGRANLHARESVTLQSGTYIRSDTIIAHQGVTDTDDTNGR
jgi:hypothetical protein